MSLNRLSFPQSLIIVEYRQAQKVLPLLMHLFIIATALMVFSSTQLLAQSQTLTINTAATPPLSTLSQDGFLDSIAKEMFKRNNLGLEIIRLPAERALKSSNSGIIDGELLRIEGMEKNYKNLIPVPETMFIQDFVAFTRNPSLGINGWDDLKLLTVAYIKGWKVFEFNIPKSAKTIIANDSQQLFALLDKNRTDVVLISRLLGAEAIFRQRIKGIRLLSPPLVQKNMKLYLHKKYKSLIPGLDKAMKEIKSEGIYSQKLNALEKQYSANE